METGLEREWVGVLHPAPLCTWPLMALCMLRLFWHFNSGLYNRYVLQLSDIFVDNHSTYGVEFSERHDKLEPVTEQIQILLHLIARTRCHNYKYVPFVCLPPSIHIYHRQGTREWCFPAPSALGIYVNPNNSIKHRPTAPPTMFARIYMGIWGGGVVSTIRKHLLTHLPYSTHYSRNGRWKFRLRRRTTCSVSSRVVLEELYTSIRIYNKKSPRQWTVQFVNEPLTKDRQR